MAKAPNKQVNKGSELHPIKRTPQPNEESVDAKIHTATQNVAVYKRVQGKSRRAEPFE